MKDLLYPLRRFHGKIYGHPLYRNIQKVFVIKFIHSIENKLKNDPRTVFLVMTPRHGNLGDHAIAFAETAMLEEEQIPYIELSDAQLHHLQAHNLLNVMNGHTILITGGGNLGTLWPEVEKLQREIILGNPDSNIFILPNTIYYGKTENDQEQLRESMRIYNGHSNLYLYAREKFSYDMMKECYRNVKLVPDMVLSLNKSNSIKERKGCIFILRKDCEKTLSEEATMKMIEEAKKIFGDNITFSDTVVDYPISRKKREKQLNDKWLEIQTAKLVVTDRLHGMIFSAITGTPCIVLNSKSPKVKGCYEFLKNLDYIKFANSEIQISELYLEMPRDNCVFDNLQLKPYFENLKDDIVSKCKKKN